MQIRFHVIGMTRDRRTDAQRAALATAHQNAQDRQLERVWRDRVECNVARRAALKGAQ